MSADIIDFLEATQPPPQTFDVKYRVIRLRGQEFTVETSIDTATRRGYQKVTRVKPETKPEPIVAAWGCRDGEDLGIAEIVVKAWVAGFDFGWLRGREALCNEINDPELRG